jgi:hypothetical protein
MGLQRGKGGSLLWSLAQRSWAVQACINPASCQPALLIVPPQAHERMTLRFIGPLGLSWGLLLFQWTRGISVPHKPPIFGLIFDKRCFPSSPVKIIFYCLLLLRSLVDWSLASCLCLGGRHFFFVGPWISLGAPEVHLMGVAPELRVDFGK